MPTPIQTAIVYQGESSSNFEKAMISQLSLQVKITQSRGERLSKVEQDVVDIKRFMALGGDDDDMIISDTPPNSPNDNPLPPPRPLSPSHPPRRTPLPTPNSPPQYDAAKKGENNQETFDQQMQMVVIASNPSQPDMFEVGRVETDYQK
ncbi:unnamed protein product [Lactuca saligna]|uniref:Uncharacterized protein n=1 Tax=Lactuca saligna TaxID=75948 RepID=A0AA36E9C2_LACSI|nr:unnamed protein product [Lactuca saligna]